MTNRRIQLYTVTEAAEMLHTHPETVRTWCRTGELQAVQRKARAPWLIPESSIEQWIEKHTYYPTASKENRDDRA